MPRRPSAAERSDVLAIVERRGRGDLGQRADVERAHHAPEDVDHRRVRDA
jgi:hypothetical protein